MKTLETPQGRLRLWCVEGDPPRSMRKKPQRWACPQINTGGECHLDAAMFSDDLPALPLTEIDLLLVENVGNLVCPANFQIGTHLNVLIASIPEGDDKPYKYPGMSRCAGAHHQQDRSVALCAFQHGIFPQGWSVEPGAGHICGFCKNG
ncbi:MAG: hypothetical protein IPO36_14725 [Anaerolineales bacterium]|nr:hypothetical protein [Anaerolineales bacterium]